MQLINSINNNRRVFGTQLLKIIMLNQYSWFDTKQLTLRNFKIKHLMWYNNIKTDDNHAKKSVKFNI